MIPVCEPFLNGNEKKYVLDCLESNWISSRGKYIERFEKGFAPYVGCKYGVSTTNGTAALHLALRTLGIGKGDEVIAPTFTMAATIFAILYVGAKPVLIDCEPDTYNIDPRQVEKKVGWRTKAILPVHLYGHPCDMSGIIEVALDYDLFIIEDAAEAIGAEFKGKKVGSLSHIACFSFYGNKILTTGEGGMLTTNRKEFSERARLLKDMALPHGPLKKYIHEDVGFNFRMTNLQAAIGLAQLERVEEYVERRRQNAFLYNSLLADTGLTLPTERGYARNVYWMYAVLARGEGERDEMMSHLRTRDVETRPFFTPMHQQPWMVVTNASAFPVADDISRRGLYLPSGTGLKPEEIEYVCQSIKEVL